MRRAPAAWAQARSIAVLGVLVHERTPDGFLGNFNLGNHYRYRGEWAEAVPHYRRAADIRPMVDYPFRRYVQALRNSQGPDEAVAACNEKLRRAPGFAPAYLERAISYEQMGREAEAMRDYAEARRTAPSATATSRSTS